MKQSHDEALIWRDLRNRRIGLVTQEIKRQLRCWKEKEQNKIEKREGRMYKEEKWDGSKERKRPNWKERSESRTAICTKHNLEEMGWRVRSERRTRFSFILWKQLNPATLWNSKWLQLDLHQQTSKLKDRAKHCESKEHIKRSHKHWARNEKSMQRDELGLKRIRSM
jgi:hypothetical protein